MTRIRPAIALGLALVAVACAQAEGQPKTRPYPAPEVAAGGKPVAKIGTVEITTAELERRMRGSSPFVQATLKDPERRVQFAATEVKGELLAQEGWRRGLYDDPQILAELRRAVAQRVLKDEMQRIQTGLDVTDAELQSAYAKREAQYNKPAEIRVAQILKKAATAAEKASAKKELDGALAKLAPAKKSVQNAALLFADLARQHSQDEATRTGGGDLGFMSKDVAGGRFSAEAAERLFTAEVGDTLLFEGATGPVLLMKTGMRREVVRTLEQVKPQLRAQVLGDKRNALFDAYVEQLKTQHGATIDLEPVRGLDLNLEGAAAPAPPDGTER